MSLAGLANVKFHAANIYWFIEQIKCVPKWLKPRWRRYRLTCADGHTKNFPGRTGLGRACPKLHLEFSISTNTS